ncbi:MAG: ABC transporter permease [Muribaculaceae bacterium]|nr:ABC transporter permease [Muribaculaceae bacterium]MDE6315155.1 ABC transporter permease [Muribaculaceae bacterium]MDE6462371.1 ABC transporter permease [Muribaculaceae bacterium]MDE6509829.1 ABC transporter permease [Muribaculaceae bacterium]
MSDNRNTGFRRLLHRSLQELGSRRMYLWAMILVPMGVAFFFLSLMHEGLPERVPTAVVDMDHSSLSTKVTRSLSSQQYVDITQVLSDYHEAMDKVQRGEIFGFFYIPRDFERDALGETGATITYYTNLTYFVPGSLAYKAFKTMAVTSSGAIVQSELTGMGLSPSAAGTLLQPIVIDTHSIGNPWLNYNIYLSNSFLPCLLELMIFLVTAWSICHEIKTGSSVEWLRAADGSMLKALAGKLLPQTVIFTIVGLAIQALCFNYNHFPMNGSWGAMTLATVLLVLASQSFGVIVSSAMPNLRLALSLCSLTGILAFSVAGFSYPVEEMYGAIGIFSHILPIRYYFLIYIDQALNGVPVYYSRLYFVGLLCFPIVAALISRNLRRFCLRPTYVP